MYRTWYSALVRRARLPSCLDELDMICVKRLALDLPASNSQATQSRVDSTLPEGIAAHRCIERRQGIVGDSQ